MSQYLLDTNHASPLIEADARMVDRYIRGGGEMFLCQPVVGELWHGVFNSQRIEANTTLLEEALARIEVLAFDGAAAIEYGRICAELQRAASPIPQIDAQIAAIARVHSLIVLTSDRHFGVVEGLNTQNWLA